MARFTHACLVRLRAEAKSLLLPIESEIDNCETEGTLTVTGVHRKSSCFDRQTNAVRQSGQLMCNRISSPCVLACLLSVSS